MENRSQLVCVYTGSYIYIFGGVKVVDDECVYLPVSRMERLNFEERKEWELVEVKNEGKAPP